jgi:hypothetical protein
MSGDPASVADAGGDTQPNSPSVYKSYLEDFDKNIVDDSAPPNEEIETTGFFAQLIPLNDPAKRAFHELALLKVLGQLPYHDHFIQIEKEEVVSQTAISRPLDANPLAIGAADSILRGHYILSVTKLPDHPNIGWRLGKGRSKHPHLGVDLLLLPPNSPSEDVAGIHARLNWLSKSAGFFIFADNSRGKGVVINAESISQDQRLITNPSTIIVGDLAYRFEYVQRDKAHEDLFQIFLERFFLAVHSNSPPIIAPTPSIGQRRVGPYIVGESIARGSYGVVSTATHERTGQLVAIKELLRTPANAKAFDREVAIALYLKDHKHVMLEVYFLHQGLTSSTGSHNVSSKRRQPGGLSTLCCHCLCPVTISNLKLMIIGKSYCENR